MTRTLDSSFNTAILQISSRIFPDGFDYLAQDSDNIPLLVGNCIEVANGRENFRNLDFKYFTATFYKKGTCHIVFKDEDLLAKFNIFGSQRKGWLPPSYGRKTYDNMEKDEQTIVDAFEGKESYSKVIANPEKYIVEDVKLLT